MSRAKEGFSKIWNDLCAIAAFIFLFLKVLFLYCAECCFEPLDYLFKKRVVARGYLLKYEYVFSPNVLTIVYFNNGESFVLNDYHLMSCKIGERIRIVKIRKRQFLEAIKD